MTEIAVETTTFLNEDRSWLPYDEKMARLNAGRLNFALFTAGTHYPNGFLPAGLVIGRVTTGGLLGPYSNAAGDGRETAVGFLYHSVRVPANLATRVAVVLVDCFAVVDTTKLPANHGLDAAGRADLPLIRYR